MKTRLIVLSILLLAGLLPTAVLHAQPPTPWLHLTAGAERRDSRGIAQVWVPAGTFLAGSTPEQVQAAYQECLDVWPGMCLQQEYTAELVQHAVTLTSGYWIDEYEVTNADYRVFVDNGGYLYASYWSAEGWQWKGDRVGPNDRECEQDLLAPDLPRTCITWYEAEAYARWRGGRLPTEAEWEYAARGPDGRAFPWGDEFDGTRLNTCDATCPNAWRALAYDDGYARTAPVGSFPAGRSWIGAYDLAGNVWEWTADWYDPLYHQSGQAIDPAAPATGIEKVLRGGAWNMPGLFSRTAYRDGVLPGSWSSIIGFRVVSDETSTLQEARP